MSTYRLLDMGDGEKWEALGDIRVVRQATGALWPKPEDAQWSNPHAVHMRSSSGGGRWQYHRKVPEAWFLEHGGLQFKIKLTDFGHTGLFPEQAENWDWIRQQLTQPDMKVLNLFGYTGGSSLAAAGAGAQVTHVDASKGVVTWARENLEANGWGEAPVRWIVDDVVKFCAREVRRGNQYQGIVLDPPTYGRGPRGQVWKIETDLIPLLEDLQRIWQNPGFLLLSCHTPGYTPFALRHILHRVFGWPLAAIESGEMVVAAEAGGVLPSGTWARFSTG